MRIVIDMQGAQSESRFRGIGRYSLSLAQAIARNAGEHEVWLALNACMPESIPDLRAAFAGLVPENRIRIFDVPCDKNPRPWMARGSELIREAFLDSLQPDLVLVTSLFEGYWANAVTSVGALKVRHRTAVILYDLIPLLNKELYLPGAELQDYYYRKIDWLKRADILLAISDSSRQEGVEHLGLGRDKVWNISAAIGHQFRPQQPEAKQAQALLDRLGIKRKLVLYAPGGFDPRKNFARLIEAYSLLEHGLREQHQLVIASKLHLPQHTELLALASRFGLVPDEMVLTGYLEDQDLVALYSLAELFVFPSTHEGFGLPVLEAMACGAPVIGSNCSSVPEVIGLPEALFDPFSARSIAQKLAQALMDDAFRVRLREHGRHQSQKFSWDDSARKALSAIESMDSRSPVDFPVLSNKALIAALAAIPDASPTEKELCQVASSVAFNAGAVDERQLLLDVSSIVHSDAKSGIQRVVRSLLQELLISPPDGVAVRPIYFDDGIYRYANHFTGSITCKPVEAGDLPIDYFQDDIYLSLDLNMHLATQMYPLHERMHLMGVQVNFIVYDLLLAQRPDWWLPPNAELFNNWLQKISLVGDNLVCISQAVADELGDWLKLHPPVRQGTAPVISSFYLGADIDNSLPTAGLPEGAGIVFQEMLARPSFLMVSTIEPRKGHAQALSAFESLWADGIDINLVIVGKKGWLVDKLVERLERHPEQDIRLFWLEGISDEYLKKVYAASTCLIAASEGEGFGLPLIEAAQHKIPIIARDIPVFREVAGTHAYYFSGMSAEDLAAAINEWLGLYRSGQHPTSDNMPWLTWKESAEQLKSIILKDRLDQPAVMDGRNQSDSRPISTADVILT